MTVELGVDFECQDVGNPKVAEVYAFCSEHAEAHSRGDNTWDICNALTILNSDGSLYSNEGSRNISGSLSSWVFTDINDENYLKLNIDGDISCGSWN